MNQCLLARQRHHPTEQEILCLTFDGYRQPVTACPSGFTNLQPIGLTLAEFIYSAVKRAATTSLSTLAKLRVFEIAQNNTNNGIRLFVMGRQPC
jgi:hypothetical protein